MPIIAIKNGRTKKFSEEVWKNLGNNKNGWEKQSDSVAENTSKKKPIPETGEKANPTKQVVENTVVKNEPVADQIVDNKLKGSDSVAENNDEKSKFISLAKSNLTKSVMKDYLDLPEVNLPYKTSDSSEDLASILFEAFNGDIAALKAKFEI